MPWIIGVFVFWLGQLLSSVLTKWFFTTKLGVFVERKINAYLDYIVMKYDITIMRKSGDNEHYELTAKHKIQRIQDKKKVNKNENQRHTDT